MTWSHVSCHLKVPLYKSPWLLCGGWKKQRNKRQSFITGKSNPTPKENSKLHIYQSYSRTDQMLQNLVMGYDIFSKLYHTRKYVFQYKKYSRCTQSKWLNSGNSFSYILQTKKMLLFSKKFSLLKPKKI